MKKLILLICLLSFVTSVAQKKPKIKGNKEVVDVYNSLEDYDAIEIEDDLNVTITQSLNNGYHLKTDENLAAIIKFEVVDEVLKVYTVNRIISSKKLDINLTTDGVKSIKLNGDATLKSMNKLLFNSLDFIALDNASYDLDLEVDDATFILSENTKGALLMRGRKANMVLNANAFLDADLTLTKLDVEINKRADVNLSGDVESMQLTATGSTDVKARKLKTQYANLIASNKSDIYIYASKELKLYAQGKSFVYVYGNPEITVDGLNDKSQIIKR